MIKGKCSTCEKETNLKWKGYDDRLQKVDKDVMFCSPICACKWWCDEV